MRMGLLILTLTVSLSLSAAEARELTFEDRVEAQQAIEKVYRRHRTKETSASLDGAIGLPVEAARRKVEETLRKSVALERVWSRRVSAADLQSEIDRMMRSTRRPEVLKELFGSLGNDPLLIAECLARPVLVDRLIRNIYATDMRFHGDLGRHVDALLATHSTLEQMRDLGGVYTETSWRMSPSDAAAESVPLGRRGHILSTSEWSDMMGALRDRFGLQDADPNDRMRPSQAPPRRTATREGLPIGKISPLYEDDESLCDAVAGLLATENVVGWFQGRMEFGPRALGAHRNHRDPRSPAMPSVM